MTWVIRLPWPDKALWPNNRGNIMPYRRAAKKARAWAMLATVGAKVPRGEQRGFRLHVTAHPIKLPQGGGKPPDTDNITAALKAYQDGIAEAMGIDDALFSMATPVIGERVHNGQIIITVEAMA